jgi:class 3 adenylate cyclase/tetratricopeptide (TPR) repeat protein
MPNSAAHQCGECGFHNDDQARFCASCGTNLHERCPKCGATVRARQNFCRACGEPLGTVRAGLPKLPTPEHLAKRISPADAERKIATVLFADIANSTEVIRDLDPEEAKRFLVPAVEIMTDAVHRYEGIVTRDRGDGIMASFGAPVALEDHAVRACYAALDMQKAIRVRAIEVGRDLGLPLEVRIGINSGPVLVTVKHEAGKARDIRVDGLTTHIAARLEPLAIPGTIMLSRDTLALAEGFVQVRAIGPRNLKGIQEPVQVCQLEGITTRIRIHALAARGMSKFIGRQHEIETLRRTAAQALSGHGQVVALVGEAGLGKSRVFLEFIHSSAMAGWLVLEAGSVSYGKSTSYLPLVELLTRYFDIHGRDDEDRVRDKIVGKLSVFSEEKLLAQTPFFLGILGMAVSNDVWTNLTPVERQRTMFDALKRLLIRESQKQPLCLVFEDLHWVDAETHAFLEMLLDSIPAARVLLLVNYRPEYQSSWAGRSYFSQVRLDPLPAASVDEMLEVLIGSHAELGPIKQALTDVTEGNPLFLEESVRSLIESGMLAGMPGQRRPLGSLLAGFVPHTIEALLESRIDRLKPELKEILQCAAVIGNDIPRVLLEAVAGPQYDIEHSVRELQAAEFLYEKTLFPETSYTFKHAMMREAAYAGLIRERRMALHADAAHAIVVLAAGRIEEHVERVARHAELGGLRDMALEYLERAGAKAFALYANTEAAGFFERALKILRQLPETRATLEQAVDLRFELRNALIALCELDRIRKSLEEIEPILTRLGDKVRSARHAAFRCNHHFLAGEQRQAIEFGEAGLHLARECGDRVVQGELLYRLGQSYHLLGENRRAIALLEESLEFTVERQDRDRFELSVIPAVVNRTWLVNALTECGDFRAGVAHARRALEISEKAEHPLSQVLGWLAVGHVLRRKGELDGAIGALEHGIVLCDRYALPIWRLRLLSSLGIAYAYCGRLVQGLELAQQALAGAEQMRLIVDQPMFLVHLGQALLLAGRIDDALIYGNRALEVALAHEGKGDEAWARFVIARTYWVSGPGAIDESVKELETALRLAFACGARPLAAYCQTTLADIHGRRGDKAKAREFTDAADSIYAELDMRPLPLDPAR